MNLLNKLIATLLPFMPKAIVGFFSKHYIAGEKMSDAINVTKELNNDGMLVTIDVLGEEVKDKNDSLEAVEIYRKVLWEINKENLKANISVKPTHMGLNLDKEFCYENFKMLVEEAGKYNNFVRIDMEDATTIDDTIEIYLRLIKEHKNVGTVFQSYLRRLTDDVNNIIPHKANLRLCKGIYNEKREVAYKNKDTINENYLYNLEKLLSNNCYVGIATHDEKLVHGSLVLIDKLQLSKDKYEFQMLLGVDPELRRIILKQEHHLRVYVPFGKDWFGYSTRRLKENPSIAGHILKGTLKRIFNIEQ